jgi:uncharacterized membrane protein YuzA (DUF378 family)
MRNPYDAIGRIGLLLAIVGAINWLLVGLFEWNLVNWIFTDSATQTVGSVGERIVYIVVGVGGLLAIPMLAATLSRARSRDTEYEQRDSSSRDLSADDTEYYYGGSKDEREASHEQSRPGRIAEPDPLRAQESRAGEAQQSQPVRKTEKVIIRTEEPIGAVQDESSVSSTESPRSDVDERLRYGAVEETDEGRDEGREEHRRAA